MRQSQQKSSAFLVCSNVKEAPIGAVCSGSTLFASILLKFVSNARQLFAADDFSRRHFQMHFFFLGALMVKGDVHTFNFQD